MLIPTALFSRNNIVGDNRDKEKVKILLKKILTKKTLLAKKKSFLYPSCSFGSNTLNNCHFLTNEITDFMLNEFYSHSPIVCFFL